MEYFHIFLHNLDTFLKACDELLKICINIAQIIIYRDRFNCLMFNNFVKYFPINARLEVGVYDHLSADLLNFGDCFVSH